MADPDHLVAGLQSALITAYCVFAVAVITSLARLFARGSLLRQLGLDDWLILAAMVMGIVLIPLNVGISSNVRRLIEETVRRPGDERPPSPSAPSHAARAAKLNYIAAVFYLTELGTIKVSILAFYRRFLPPRPYGAMLYALAGSIICFTLAAVLAFIFQCRPVSGAWDMLVPKCQVDIPQLQLAICTFNLVTDIMILCLPIRAVWKLQVNLKKRIVLIILFTVGVAGTVVTALRLKRVVELTRAYNVDLVAAMLLVIDIIKWSQLEVNLIIACANLPALAALWKHVHEGGRSTRSGTGSYLQSARSFFASKSWPEAGGTTTAASGKGFRCCTESVSPPSLDIVRSTNIVINLEDRPQHPTAPSPRVYYSRRHGDSNAYWPVP